jgi:protein pelota
MSITLATLEANLVKKGNAAQMTGAKKGTERWYEQILAVVSRHVDFGLVRCVVLAGPGFVKDGFFEWCFAEAARREMRPLLLSRPNWVVAHASSGYKHALKEALAQPAVASRVADTKAAGEVAALASFFATMSADADRVAYGLRHTRRALEQGAVAKLLVSDSLLRAQHVERRATYVALVEAATAVGAAVHIFSSLHVSGEQLAKLSGVAAVLRFPLPMEDVDEELEAEAEAARAAARAEGGAAAAAADDDSDPPTSSEEDEP